MGTLKLEFNDNHDTILYLNDIDIDQVRIARNNLDRDASVDIFWISIQINNSDDPYMLIYKTIQDRDIDYEYAIKQLDILMNINKEEI